MTPASFAYPYGAYDTNAEQIVQSCGFSSARITGGIDRNGRAPGRCTPNHPAAGPYAVRTVYNGGGSAEFDPIRTGNRRDRRGAERRRLGAAGVPRGLLPDLRPRRLQLLREQLGADRAGHFQRAARLAAERRPPRRTPAGVVVQTVRHVVNSS
jgi:hypothetical protein